MKFQILTFCKNSRDYVSVANKIDSVRIT